MVQTTKSPHALVVNIFALTSLAFNLETSRDLIVHSNWSVPVAEKKLGENESSQAPSPCCWEADEPRVHNSVMQYSRGVHKTRLHNSLFKAFCMVLFLPALLLWSSDGGGLIQRLQPPVNEFPSGESIALHTVVEMQKLDDSPC